MPTKTPAIIITAGPGRPSNELPGFGHPDNTLPGGGQIDNSLPGFGGRPDNSLPPTIGVWPPRPVVWPPVPPISIDIDPDVGISLPIYLPGSPDNTLPPVAVEPGHPANPIVLPPLPSGANVMVALVLPLPMAEPKAGGSGGGQPALLWYGPGTIPQVAVLAPAATPKAAPKA